MYLSAEAVLEAIDVLRAEVHPFLGITLMACKRFDLSIGDVENVSLDGLTREHLDEHHRINRRSSLYFQPFRSASWWVAEKYPSSGLQTVNTQTFKSVFIHPRRSRKWGFEESYLDRIQEVLSEQGFATQVPPDALAVWLFKDHDLGDVSTFEELVQLFFAEYNINNQEQKRLFGPRSMRGQISEQSAFVPEPLEMTAVARALPAPYDKEAEGGRSITSLSMFNIGPAREMAIDFGQRLTIITGDNGLGKSFLLDTAWWAATGAWADKPLLSDHTEQKAAPVVKYTLGKEADRSATFTVVFDRRSYSWLRPQEGSTVEALAVFSRADGSFAVADPVRSVFNQFVPSAGSLSASDVWNGRPGLMEGLLRDWIRWQSAVDGKAFDQFASILRRLSPEDLGILTPGPSVRLPGDPRDIPTIQHRYGTVPVTQASAGVQRVLLLAYLIIWSWQEHELASDRLERSALRRMLVLVDELEAHLHPKWQRIVLPALMGVGDLLSSDLVIQTIAATHSPMILASMEASFDEETDSLYHLFGADSSVQLEEVKFVKYGDVSGWLTSPLFGLRHARSREAEVAIERAKALQLAEHADTEEVRAVSDLLRTHLAGDDKFWPRWLYFAEQHGVQL